MSGLTNIRRFLTLLVCFSIGHAIVKSQENDYYSYYSRNLDIDVVSLVISFLLGFIYLYVSVVDPFSADENDLQHPRPWDHIRLTFATLVGSIVLAVWNLTPIKALIDRWPFLVWACLAFLESCASFYCWKLVLLEDEATETGCDVDRDSGEGQGEGHFVDEEVMTYQGMEEGRMRRDAQGRLDHALQMVQVQNRQLEQIWARRSETVPVPVVADVVPIDPEVVQEGGSLYVGKVELDENDRSHDPAPMPSLAEGSPGSSSSASVA